MAVSKTDDVKTHGINAVLEAIVNEITYLEINGFQVEIPQFEGSVNARMAQICGYSVGLNSILGYTESFVGNSVCRWRRIHRDVLKVQTIEDPSAVCDKENYISVSLLRHQFQTGSKRDCSLNKLLFYHVTDNVAPNIMHDILEGVGDWEIKLVLNALMDQEVLTIEQLNYRLTSFDYGGCDSRNKPSAIKLNGLIYDSAYRQTAI